VAYQPGIGSIHPTAVIEIWVSLLPLSIDTVEKLGILASLLNGEGLSFIDFLYLSKNADKYWLNG